MKPSFLFVLAGVAIVASFPSRAEERSSQVSTPVTISEATKGAGALVETYPGYGSSDPEPTPEQRKRMEYFGLVVFSPPLPGHGLQSHRVLRGNLLKRFGHPLRVEEKERSPRDPSNPVEIVTTWVFPGLILITIASKPTPDVLWVKSVEVNDAKVALRYGLRVGRSLDHWVSLFGPPARREGYLQYGGEYYYACGDDKLTSCGAAYQIRLFLDSSNKVRRITWSYGF